MKAPKPLTKNAWLISEGVTPPRYTKHVYRTTIRTGDSWRHLFTCQETGAVRVWGVDDFFRPDVN